MCSIDLETCEVFAETTRKARNPHTCDSCDGPILPGQYYVKHFSVFEGIPHGAKMCSACDRVRAEFAKDHGQTFAPNNLIPMLEECIQDGDPESDRKWKPMLETVLARRELSAAKRGA